LIRLRKARIEQENMPEDEEKEVPVKSEKKVISKAIRKLRKVKKGQHIRRSHRIYTRPRFYKPKTLKAARKQKFPRHFHQEYFF
jgi:hypothetical protein